MPFFDQRHDARLHGHADARQGQHVAEAEKVFVVVKQLGIQVSDARVYLLFQVADIGDEVGAVGVAFGVAGACNVKIIPASADIAHQVGRVAELFALFGARNAVAAQRQNVPDAEFLQLLQRRIYLFPPRIDAG